MWMHQGRAGPSGNGLGGHGAAVLLLGHAQSTMPAPAPCPHPTGQNTPTPHGPHTQFTRSIHTKTHATRATQAHLADDDDHGHEDEGDDGEAPGGAEHEEEHHAGLGGAAQQHVHIQADLAGRRGGRGQGREGWEKAGERQGRLAPRCCRERACASCALPARPHTRPPSRPGRTWSETVVVSAARRDVISPVLVVSKNPTSSCGQGWLRWAWTQAGGGAWEG